MRKGIILAGGTGSRLYPITNVVCKQLLPVYDKPMIYYSLSVLMLAGIRDILIISTTQDLPRFQKLLDDGSALGVHLSFMEQTAPRGIAEALILGEEFLNGHPLALILGDNIFFGDGLSNKLQKLSEYEDAVVISYQVTCPEAYGVIEVDETGKPLTIEEKPKIPKSLNAVTGLYFYPPDAPSRARKLSPSRREELEITDLNRSYLDENRLRVEHFGRGYAWLDAGTEKDLLEASNFIATFERRQGIRIGCIEEVAWRMGWISASELNTLGLKLANSTYGKYLMKLASETDESR